MTGRRLALLACPLAAILLYLPTRNHDFVFDDRGVIEQNRLLRDGGQIPRLLLAPYWNAPGHPSTLYRPLTSLTYALDRAAAGGLRPGWFHLVNVLLHGLATLLVTALALELLPGAGAPALTGILFAVHPIQSEAVAGIVGRAEILAACGALSAVLAHRRALRVAAEPEARRFMAGSWGAACLGMLAKESAATTPLLCALADAAFPTMPGSPPGRRAKLYAGHAVVLAVVLAARVLVLGAPGVGAPIPFIDNPAASAGPLDGRLTALAVLPRYALLLLWPRHLSADYSFDQIPLVRSILHPAALGGLLLAFVVVAGGAAVARIAPLCGFALLWMGVSASLTTNLVIFIGTLMAERLMYLPSVGLCLLAGSTLAALVRRDRARLAAFFGIALIGAASARTWARIPDWKDDFALYTSAARVSPRSARIRYNLGNACLRRQDYRRAEENYRTALEIYPDYGDARVNLGMAILQQGRAGEALGILKGAAARQPSNADLAVDLGGAYRAAGDQALAESEFRRALAIDPRSARAWNNLGSLALGRGHAAEAVADLEIAVRIEPDFAVYRINLADALTAAGRAREAERQFEAASRLDADLPEAHRGAGEVALRHEDRRTAEWEFRVAAAGNPPSARAANFLGYLLAERGEARAAVEQYELAVRIDPRLADAHRSLGLIYARQLGDPARAARHLRISLGLDPDQAGADEMRALLRELGR